MWGALPTKPVPTPSQTLGPTPTTSGLMCSRQEPSHLTRNDRLDFQTQQAMEASRQSTHATPLLADTAHRRQWAAGKGPILITVPTCLVAGMWAPQRALAQQPRFRFWIDEVLWSQGVAAVQLLEEVLLQAGGQRTGGPHRGPEVSASNESCLGGSQPHLWDLLWTKSTYAIQAARLLRPGQQVSMVVGLNSLTMKKRMLQTLKAAYGAEGAAALTPLSFALPEEQSQWEAWLAIQPPSPGSPTNRHPAATSSSPESSTSRNPAAGTHGGSTAVAPDQSSQLWLLKTGQDAGKGLYLLPAAQALQFARAAAAQASGEGRAASKRKHQLQVAQLYVERPLLLDGRKFHLRLWVVVTGACPLQAYLHRRGLVLFSSESYDQSCPFASSETSTHSSAQAPAPPSAACTGIHVTDNSTPINSNPSTVSAAMNNSTDTHSACDHNVSHKLARSSALQSQSLVPPASPHPRYTSNGASSANKDTSSASNGTSSATAQGQGQQGPGWKHISPGHITNLARNSSGWVWDLEQLGQRLGPVAWAKLWKDVERSTRLMLHAAHAPMQEAHAWLRPPFPNYGWQLLGVDFLVDCQLRPWILEVNSSPSIMALHDDPVTAQLVNREKLAMLRDMIELVLPRVHPPGGRPEAGPGKLGDFVALHSSVH